MIANGIIAGQTESGPSPWVRMSMRVQNGVQTDGDNTQAGGTYSMQEMHESSDLPVIMGALLKRPIEWLEWEWLKIKNMDKRDGHYFYLIFHQSFCVLSWN